MYSDFFGLRELPFNNTPDPRFFYSTPEHEEALASLIYAVRERKGFALLTGEVGAGKTLVSRIMLRHFGSQIAFASINHAIQNASDLMESVCTEFELSFKPGSSNTQLVRILQDFLLNKFSLNTPVVLVLDEAQNLPIDAFEQLRMIGNLEADDAKLLQIIIVGQPELQQRFASQELRQLRQRVFRSFHLAALSRDATDAYIQHRLEIAGLSSGEIFDDDAIDTVYRISKGLPRLINTLCDNALLSAYSADRKTIDDRFISSVAKQMLMGGDVDEPTCPPPGSDAGYQAQGSAFSSGGSDVAQRVIRLESKLERTLDELRAPTAHLWATSTTEPDAQADGVGEHHARLSQGLSQFDQHLAARLDEASRRFAELEQSVRHMPALVAQARRVSSGLTPLVTEVKSVVARAESMSHVMQDREANGKQLSAKVRALIGDVRTILDELKTAATRAGKDERRAKAVLERLTQQTQQSQELADEMNSVIARGVPLARNAPGVVTVVSEATAQADDLLPGSPEPDSGTEMAEAFGDTRKSLSDLRSLARAPQGSEAPRDDEAAPATDRLEQHVEGLLDMIESGGE